MSSTEGQNDGPGASSECAAAAAVRSPANSSMLAREMRASGSLDVAGGSIEAVEVGDGRLTALVQLGRSGERVRLRVPAALWPSVRRYLCC